MQSLTEENYLKAIYKLTSDDGEVITTNAIADKIETKAASVTDMLKKLADKKLINYQKYQGVTLTKKGEKIALTIVRKHRLWEMFLVEKLGFKWDEVHEVAEQLEHINSEKLIDEIDRYLNYPKFDPHGDPIPDSNGKVQKSKSKLLSEFKENDVLIISGVIDHSNAFLQYLDRSGLVIGNEIRIKSITDFDKSLAVLIKRKDTVFISNKVAKNILATIK